MLSVIGMQLITPPAAPSGVPADMREYLNLAPGVDSDKFLTDLYLRAAGIVESTTGLTVLQSGYKLYFSGDGTSLRLPLFPVSSAASLSAANPDSVQPGAFSLQPAPGYFWQLVFPEKLSGLYTINVTAGYVSPECVPPAAIGAIYAIAADMYEHREAQSEVKFETSKTIRDALDSISILKAGAV